MAHRTFAIGDIHGDLEALERLLAQLPVLDAEDSLVFVGDYVDHGPRVAEVVELVRRGLAGRTPARVVALRGNHEDAWLRVVRRGGWPEFVLRVPNGCASTYRSYAGLPPSCEAPSMDDLLAMMAGAFFPVEVLDWFDALPHYHEDAHAIYVHAGLPEDEAGVWPHPSQVTPPETLLWVRKRGFFERYRGKPVVVGHTVTTELPPELSCYTPEDPADLWAGEAGYGLDTGCGKGGFLTALELPALRVYESRTGLPRAAGQL